MRKFIVITESATPMLQNRVTEFFKALGVSWSHYFSNAWLLVDNANRSARWWFTQIDAIGMGGKFAVFEVMPRAWWARGPATLESWMRRAWMPPNGDPQQ